MRAFPCGVSSGTGTCTKGIFRRNHDAQQHLTCGGEPPPPDNEEPFPDDDSTYAGTKKTEGLAMMREFREWVTEQQHALEDWQKRVDGRVRGVVENISPFGALHKDVKTLSDRIAELEAKLSQLAEDETKNQKS